MKTQELENDTVKQVVRERYGQIAEEKGSCGCSSSGCGPVSQDSRQKRDLATLSRGLGYSAEDVASVPGGSNLGLGCGNPQAIAKLKSGETVLDLGSGAGFDVFLAARAVGSGGFVIGVDMTPQMISKARRNQATAAYGNVEFRLGEIESLPVADSSIDVIISNCVINLSPDKERVFREAFRVLKPGGRLAVSDVIALAPIPGQVHKDWALYTGCVTGASTADALRTMLEDAGFRNIRIVPKEENREMVVQSLPGPALEDYVGSGSIEAEKPGTRP